MYLNIGYSYKEKGEKNLLLIRGDLASRVSKP